MTLMGVILLGSGLMLVRVIPPMNGIVCWLVILIMIRLLNEVVHHGGHCIDDSHDKLSGHKHSWTL